MQLFCFPFAGGGAYSYRRLYPHWASFITPHTLELPGRGGRGREPLLLEISGLVEDSLARVVPQLSSAPYAFFGHSMGALLAFLLTHKILALGLAPPCQLFLSGRTAPGVPDRVPSRHLLPRQEFLAMLDQFAGSPQEVLANQELMEYFEPVLRADFQASGSYRHHNLPPLPVPITLLYGENEGYSREQFMEWQKETSHHLAAHCYPGGHFFIFEQSAEIGELISVTLAKRM